jgi:hypothetical protein
MAAVFCDFCPENSALRAVAKLAIDDAVFLLKLTGLADSSAGNPLVGRKKYLFGGQVIPLQ